MQKSKIRNRARGIAFAALATLAFLSSSIITSAAPALSAPALRDGTITLKVGEEVQTQFLDAGNPIENTRFESGNTGFFSVDATGKIKGVHEGATMLSARAGNLSDSITVIVQAKDGSFGKLTSAGRREAVNGIVAANEGGVVRVGFVERIMAHLLPYEAIGRNPFTISSSNPNVMSVDDSVKVVEALRPGRARIMVATLDGKFKTAVDYEVVMPPPPKPVKTIAMQPGKLKYDASDEATARANSAALQAALDHAAANGFNHLLLEKDKKFFIEPKDTIYMVEGVSLDLNGSEICLRPNEYERYAAFRFGDNRDGFKVVNNASIVNGTITGERDGKEEWMPNWKKTPATEGGCTIIFDGGRHNGISNLVVRKSIGFNISSGIGPATPEGRFGQRGIGKNSVELGSFDVAGKPVPAPGMIRTKKAIDISKMAANGTYVLGFPLGYQGYPHMNARIYDVWWFGAGNNLVKAERGRYRYRIYDIPEGAKTAHFAFYFPAGGLIPGPDGLPATHDGDFGAFVFMESRHATLDNYMLDCTITDNFSCGFAACGGQRWVIRGNTFRNNGGRMPGFDIDWEDGWDYMQGDLVENNKFESAKNIVVCAGSGLIFRKNTFNGMVLFYGRTQNCAFMDNVIEDGSATFEAQSDFHLARNVYRNSRIATSRQHGNFPGAEYRIVFTDETFEGSHFNGRGGMSEATRCTFEPYDEPVNVSARIFTDSVFGPGAYRAVSGSFRNAKTDNAAFVVDKGAMLEFQDSTLLNPVFSASVTSLGLNIVNSAINIDKPLTFVSPGNMTRVRLANTTFTLAREASPFVFAGGHNADGIGTRVDLESVKFQTTGKFDGFIHKFNWYPKPDAETKMVYNLIGTKLPAGIKITDEKGEKSNAVFNKKP